MADPINAADQKADDESGDLGSELKQSMRKLLDLVRQQGGDLDLQDEQRHGDGEDAIGQGFDPPLADASGVCGVLI